MHVVAFAPSTRVVVNDEGGVRADGFPMTSAHVEDFPQQITIPVVLAAYTEGGSDYDPRLYIAAKSPQGERISTVECSWHWPDKPGAPVKFWVLSQQLPLRVQSAGLHTIGLYDNPDATENDHLFPLPGFKFNPLLTPPQ